MEAHNNEVDRFDPGPARRMRLIGVLAVLAGLVLIVFGSVRAGDVERAKRWQYETGLLLCGSDVSREECESREIQERTDDINRDSALATGATAIGWVGVLAGAAAIGTASYRLTFTSCTSCRSRVSRRATTCRACSAALRPS